MPTPVDTNRLFLEPEDAEIVSIMESRKSDTKTGETSLKEPAREVALAQWELLPPTLPLKESGCQTVRVTNLIKGLKRNEVEGLFASEVGPVQKCIVNEASASAQITFDTARHAAMAAERFNGSILEAPSRTDKQDPRVLSLKQLPWHSAGTTLRETFERYFCPLVECHYRRGECWLTFASVSKVKELPDKKDEPNPSHKGSIIQVVLDPVTEGQATGVIQG